MLAEEYIHLYLFKVCSWTDGYKTIVKRKMTEAQYPKYEIEANTMGAVGVRDTRYGKVKARISPLSNLKQREESFSCNSRHASWQASVCTFLFSLSARPPSADAELYIRVSCSLKILWLQSSFPNFVSSVFIFQCS